MIHSPQRPAPHPAAPHSAAHSILGGPHRIRRTGLRPTICFAADDPTPPGGALRTRRSAPHPATRPAPRPARATPTKSRCAQHPIPHPAIHSASTISTTPAIPHLASTRTRPPTPTPGLATTPRRATHTAPIGTASSDPSIREECGAKPHPYRECIDENPVDCTDLLRSRSDRRNPASDYPGRTAPDPVPPAVRST